MTTGKIILPEISWVNPLKPDVPGLFHRTYYSSSMNRQVGYCIYLPPQYMDNQARSCSCSSKELFPVIYWLHGKGGDESTGFKIKVPHLYHKAVTEGKVNPAIMVFPNCGSYSMFCDSLDGKIMGETVIIKELIPLVNADFNSIKTGYGRALEGFSMGGFGAVKLAFKYPELFSSVVTLAGSFHDLESVSQKRPEVFEAIFGSSGDYYQQNSPYVLLEKNLKLISEVLKIKMVNGSEDFTLSNNLKFNDTLDKYQVKYDFKILEGLRHQPLPYYELEGFSCLKFHFG